MKIEKHLEKSKLKNLSLELFLAKGPTLRPDGKHSLYRANGHNLQRDRDSEAVFCNPDIRSKQSLDFSLSTSFKMSRNIIKCVMNR